MRTKVRTRVVDVMRVCMGCVSLLMCCSVLASNVVLCEDA